MTIRPLPCLSLSQFPAHLPGDKPLYFARHDLYSLLPFLIPTGKTAPKFVVSPAKTAVMPDPQTDRARSDPAAN